MVVVGGCLTANLIQCQTTGCLQRLRWTSFPWSPLGFYFSEIFLCYIKEHFSARPPFVLPFYSVPSRPKSAPPPLKVISITLPYSFLISVLLSFRLFHLYLISLLSQPVSHFVWLDVQSQGNPDADCQCSQPTVFFCSRIDFSSTQVIFNV